MIRVEMRQSQTPNWGEQRSGVRHAAVEQLNRQSNSDGNYKGNGIRQSNSDGNDKGNGNRQSNENRRHAEVEATQGQWLEKLFEKFMKSPKFVSVLQLLSRWTFCFEMVMKLTKPAEKIAQPF